MKSHSTIERWVRRAIHPGWGCDAQALRAAVADKTVVVTGASFGIGEATARRLGASGARVLLVARTAAKLDQVAAAIRADGGSAEVWPADLGDPSAAADLGRRIVAVHGGVDVVVNNAGKSIRRSLALTYDRFHDIARTAAVNYLGPIQLLLVLLPAMARRGQGHVVNVSSMAVRIAPGPRWGAYQASKGAFDLWFRSVASELRADGIASTSIYPALVHTRMSAPTPTLHRAPGLSADEAAGLVARAIAYRPRSIAPWWLFPVEVLSVVLRGPLDRMMSVVLRSSADTERALHPHPRTEP